MIELSLLALLNQLHSWGRSPVIATRVIAADVATLRRLVTAPACRALVVAGVSPLLRASACRGPRSSEHLVSVRVRLGRRDVLWLTWILSPSRGTTEVDLAAQVESHGLAVRLALALGGRRWLAHRLDAILATLAALAHHAAEDVADVAPQPSPVRAISRPGGARPTI